MKFFLLVASILSFSLMHAQPGGGGQRGGGMGGSPQGGGQMGQERPEMREFKATEAAGVFTYDSDEAIKKIKIKKDKDLVVNARKAIANYNRKINEIELLNKDNFDTLNVFMNAMKKARQSNRGQNRGSQQMGYGNENNRGMSDENEGMRDIMRSIREKIDIVKNEVKQEENKLNGTLENLLNEKQYKKWLKYQEDVKEEQNPKPKSNNQNGSQMRSGGGGQGGPPSGGGMGMR